MNRRRIRMPKPSSTLPDFATENDNTKNSVQGAFRLYAEELEEKHDRYERIIKLSRDITIESKRIISTLHSIRTSASDASSERSVLMPVRERIARLMSTNFAAISHELSGRDPYQFVRAYSAGLQEFVEALTMLQYVSGEPIGDWSQLEKVLTATVSQKAESESVPSDDQVDGNVVDAHASGSIAIPPFCLVEPMDFMLGLCDLSGEVMRMCVNALADRHFDTCTRGCAFLRTLFMGFRCLLVQRNRSLMTKLTVMKQSMLKVENVCYNIVVRGKEANIGSLMSCLSENADDTEVLSTM